MSPQGGPDGEVGDERRPETVVARLRPHGRALFWPCVLLVLVAGGTGLGLGRFDLPWADAAVLVAAGALVLIGVLLPLLRWATTSYTITTRRLVLRSGVLAHVRQETLHSRGHDVTIRRSLGQRMAGSGDVGIRTGADGTVTLRDVPHPDLVAEALQELMETNATGLSVLRYEERMRRSGEHGSR